MYNDENGVSINYRVLSMHPLFRDDCVFLSLANPSPDMFVGLELSMLPTIGVVPKLDENFKEGNVEQSNIGAN